MVIFVPGTEETDPKRQNMSLQQIGAAATALQASVATNTSDIATLSSTVANKVTGPASATDNALARFDATTGKLIQNSEVTLGDTDGRLSRTAGVSVSGTNTNDNAAAGYVGEYASNSATTGTLTSGSPTNITSIPLTAGDWDITADFAASGSGAPLVTEILVSINTVTATANTTVGQHFRFRSNAAPSSIQDLFFSSRVGELRASLTGSATYYLNTTCTYTGGGATYSVSGIIRARRVR